MKTYEEELRQFKEDLERLPTIVPPPKPRLEGKVLSFPDVLSDQELCRRQAVIDAAWERNLEAKRELEAEAARSFHRGPGDSDYRLR
jgi:hypothetical protein